MKLFATITIILMSINLIGQNSNDGSFKIRKLNNEISSFPGGDNNMSLFINSRTAVDFSAIVHLRFKVCKNGLIRKIKVTKGVNKRVDKKAIKIVKGMPRWEPAKIDGKSVNSFYKLKIEFTKTY